MKSPYVYFGGKSAIAPKVWAAFGNVPNYVEPFFGSGAVLLARPSAHAVDGRWPLETINDKCGFVSNFWRAIQSDPGAVAEHADWPVFENDLHARHAWLVGQKNDMTRKIEGDPEYFDAKIAGWWVWGMACWIGSGFCSGQGPWQVNDGELVKAGGSPGVNRKRIHLGGPQGIKRSLARLDGAVGVRRERLKLGSIDKGASQQSRLASYFEALQSRMLRVRVASGDWSRVCGPSPTTAHGLTGVFLDPPYELNGRDKVYNHDCSEIAMSTARWAVEHGGNPLLRIVYAGYESDEMSRLFEDAGWTKESWSAHGGLANAGNGRGRANAKRERLWFSPHCLQSSLFDTNLEPVQEVVD